MIFLSTNLFSLECPVRTYETIKKSLDFLLLKCFLKSISGFLGDSLVCYSEHYTPTHKINLNIPKHKKELSIPPSRETWYNWRKVEA